MRIASALLTWPVVALGGLGLFVPTAQAGGHGTGYKEFTFLSRKVAPGAPVLVGAPAVVATPQSALITGVPQSAFIGVPQSALIGVPQSAMITGFAQSSILNISASDTSGGSRGESAGLSSKGNTGGGGTGGGGTGGGLSSGGGTTVCPELSKKIDDLDKKVDRLQGKVDELEKKVDKIVAWQQQQEAERQQKQQLAAIEKLIDLKLKANNEALAGEIKQLFADHSQAQTQNLVGLIDELAKKEKGDLGAFRAKLLSPPTMVPPKQP